MLKPRYVFAVLFKSYRDMLAVFAQSCSVPVFDARRAEHYVARASDLYDPIRRTGVNFTLRYD